MKINRLFGVLSMLVVLYGCEDKYHFKLISPTKIKVNKALTLKVLEKNDKKADSISYFLDGIRLNQSNRIDISKKVLGKHALKAVVYFNNRKKQFNNTIYFLAAQAPDIYGYKVVNSYPHDADAYTQGLEYNNGFLYESTGQRGKSSLRKVELKSGKVLKIKKLDKQYFGEGMTIFNNQIFMLTWQKKIGFVFNLTDFKLLKTFDYGMSKEGWGLTHNQTELIKSDGTERIWYLDPKTQKETHFIEAYTDTRKAEELNELEYINDKIYANVWQKNTILIINSTNGAIEGIIDLKGLNKLVTKGNENDVLNGIAYDKNTNRLFVTGKDWDKLFEIKIFKKQ